MNDQKNDQQQVHVQRLTDQIQQGLNEAADGLDMCVQSRLRRMRAQAVEAVEHPSAWQRMRRGTNKWLFMNPVVQGAAFASVTTLAVSLWLMPGYQAGDEQIATLPVMMESVDTTNTTSIKNVTTHAQNATVHQENGMEVNEMDVLMSNEDMDFLENLEVYEWLEAEYG